MTTQQTSGTWHRIDGRREWRIDTGWEDARPEGWVVTRCAHRTNFVHEWEWHNYTELTLRKADGDVVDVIVDESDWVRTLDGETAEDDVFAVAQSFRTEAA